MFTMTSLRPPVRISMVVVRMTITMNLMILMVMVIYTGMHMYVGWYPVSLPSRECFLFGDTPKHHIIAYIFDKISQVYPQSILYVITVYVYALYIYKDNIFPYLLAMAATSSDTPM